MPNACQWCGAALKTITIDMREFCCGTKQDRSTPLGADHTAIRTEDCYKREIKLLRDKLIECVAHFRLYEMDVDDEPPNHHRLFILRLQKAIDND